ncbi:LacI family DNA-binding transcriptional regulator [Demequina sp. NBRC 110055]|uniref:LacI family DNA-binding transcriptional regulator n=1 Tax=Demequina sp. NBRC 110055 TaxID=1570344 RepID=UPI0009FC19C2|nr:LacI family DNA-binding transcriptional regulator [Demequina sp. NBRC 110055]
MATIQDVAREAGVSISTVSYALSGKRSIKPSTRDRVLDAASRLGYLPHASARMLAANRSQIFAVTAPLHTDTDHSAHMVFAMEVTKAARTHGYDTLLLVDDDVSEGMRRSAASSLADGIVVLDVDAHDPRADLARSMTYPTVFIGIPADTTGLVCVDLDFEAAARLAIDTLVSAGRQRIGLVSHPLETMQRESNFPLRFRDGFAAHAAELGLEAPVAYPVEHRAHEAVAQLLAAQPDLDGLVLNTSVDVASSVTAALAEHGRSVPQDVAVIAAGVTFSTERFAVPFDTIPLDARASCSVAVDILARIVDDNLTAPETTLIPPTYITRGSVSPTGAAVTTGT